MHYIPFNNENPRNRDNEFDCRSCPCFEGNKVYDYSIIGTCRYNQGLKEEFKFKDFDKESFNVKLSAANTRNCPIRYRDPVERFHYLQFRCIVYSDFHNCCKELFENKNLTEEEKTLLEEKRDKLMDLSKLMEEIYYKSDQKANKIMLDGYKMDENMELFK